MVLGWRVFGNREGRFLSRLLFLKRIKIMTDEAFKKAVIRGLYAIMLGVLRDKRYDLNMILNWRKEVLKDNGPEPFYRQ